MSGFPSIICYSVLSFKHALAAKCARTIPVRIQQREMYTVSPQEKLAHLFESNNCVYFQPRSVLSGARTTYTVHCSALETVKAMAAWFNEGRTYLYLKPREPYVEISKRYADQCVLTFHMKDAECLSLLKISGLQSSSFELKVQSKFLQTKSGLDIPTSLLGTLRINCDAASKSENHSFANVKNMTDRTDSRFTNITDLVNNSIRCPSHPRKGSPLISNAAKHSHPSLCLPHLPTMPLLIQNEDDRMDIVDEDSNEPENKENSPDSSLNYGSSTISFGDISTFLHKCDPVSGRPKSYSVPEFLSVSSKCQRRSSSAFGEVKTSLAPDAPPGVFTDSRTIVAGASDSPDPTATETLRFSKAEICTLISLGKNRIEEISLQANCQIVLMPITHEMITARCYQRQAYHKLKISGSPQQISKAKNLLRRVVLEIRSL
ncbi:hypothetical protein PUMCH_004975 [Australozyma saopauloensis]|uniref:CABIT domain-containing protein n=1 Tax=Australozyma saopauloensis TaxID=291208 RepID=A0AAX4HHL0_9ASCO|nr:hypothetical protein PUMCH_004975 [[Candida] saopauloensis]